MKEKNSFTLYIKNSQTKIASNQLHSTVYYEQGGTTLTVNLK